MNVDGVAASFRRYNPLHHEELLPRKYLLWLPMRQLKPCVRQAMAVNQLRAPQRSHKAMALNAASLKRLAI